MSSWSFHKPPRVFRTAQLDNLVLVPASLLPDRATYQQLANRLPRGQVLFISPAGNTKRADILRKVAHQLEAKGQHVTIKEEPA